MNKTYLTAYLMTNGNIGMIEAKKVPDLLPKEKISLFATTTK